MKNLFIIIGVLVFSSLNVVGQPVSLDGYWSYQCSGNQVCISGDKISNSRNGGKSGTLKLALYATDAPYNGGNIYGYCLAETKMTSRLSGGEYFYNIVKNTNLSRPPKGWYCMTILLLEYNNNSYSIIDWISFNNPACF